MPIRSALSLVDAVEFFALGRDPGAYAGVNIAQTPLVTGFGAHANALAFDFAPPHAPPPEPIGPTETTTQAGDAPAAVFNISAPDGGFALHELVHVVQYTGVSSNRVDIVFLGDGYTAGELSTTYMAHVMGYLNYMFADTPLTDPFSQYQNFFNIYVVDVVSQQSGADDPTAGTFVNTALDASYLWDGETQRLLYINHNDAVAVLNTVLVGSGIGQEMLFVTVNSAQYGGGGGYFGVFAGGNASAYEVALHEIGHSFTDLADEYFYDSSHYSGGEPSAPNVTISPTGADWAEWLGYEDPILGTVGAFEGGMYAATGIYRPTADSRMRSLNRPFDAIAREQFILQFYALVNPLDGWDANSGTRTNVLELNVDTLDPALIHVDWTVNGVLHADMGETLDMGADAYGWGTFTITARAYDPTPWVRGDRSSLEQSVSWTVINDYRLVGTGIGETLTGNGNAQTIVGLGGNDVFRGLGANDVFQGGAGSDAAQYLVASSAASWHRNPDGSWTVTTAGEGADTMTTVEFLDFTDRDVFLDRAARTFSGDGTSDILLRRADGVTAIWTMNGAIVTGGAPTEWQAGSVWSLQGFGDFNNDGRDDFLLRRNADSVTAVWSMNSTAVIASGVTNWQAGSEWQIQGIGDFNGDGSDDFLWRRGSDGVTAIWQVNGTIVLQGNVTLWQAGNEWQIQDVGDFNGDGRDDFLWRRASDGVTAIWHMNGSNVSSADVTTQQAGAEWTFSGVGDFNGDGRDDLLLRRTDGTLAIWMMNGTNVASAALTSQQAGGQWQIAAVGDYNGDGRDDILLRHDNGLIAVWTMNGATVVSANLTTQQTSAEWSII